MASAGKIKKLSVNDLDIPVEALVSMGLVYPKQTLWQRIKDWWTYRKLRRALRGMTVEFEFRGLLETKPYDPYREWKHLHRN